MAIDVSKLKFRKATPNDIDAIVALVNRAYRGGEARQTWTNEATILDGIRTDAPRVKGLIQQKGCTVLLMSTESEDLIGCVHLEVVAGDTCYLGMLTVDPGLQNHGLGRKLLEASEDFVRKEFSTVAKNGNDRDHAKN